MVLLPGSLEIGGSLGPGLVDLVALGLPEELGNLPCDLLPESLLLSSGGLLVLGVSHNLLDELGELLVLLLAPGSPLGLPAALVLGIESEDLLPDTLGVGPSLLLGGLLPLGGVLDLSGPGFPSLLDRLALRPGRSLLSGADSSLQANYPGWRIGIP